jgi:S1-C subfamily serine protease
MALDDDDAEEGGGSRPPLPPDDRLWRHPSELGAHPYPALAPANPVRSSGAGRWTPLASVLVAGLAGAVLTFGLMAVTGLSPRVVQHQVIEKVAVTPVVSSPVQRTSDGVEAVAQHLSPAIVRLDVDRAGQQQAGSGVVFRDDGMVLTSAHVVENADQIDVVLNDGRRFRGTLIGLDEPTDVAVVDIAANNLPVAVLGSAKGLAIGAPAMAIGSPSSEGGTAAVSTGVISAMGRTVDAADGAALHGMLQTDAPIAPESCGGALVDTAGSVVGIMTAVTADVGQRWGFATPIDLAHMVALELIQHGKAALGWLGVEGIDLTADQATLMGVAGGARVSSVAPNSPASAAGLAPDDVITDVDGQPVSSMPSLMVELRDHQPGDRVQVGYVRHGQRGTTTVKLGQHP